MNNQTKKPRRSKRTNKERQIRIISVNARGIKSKLASLKMLIAETEPDIVAIQETKLNDKEKISIANYQWIDGSRKVQKGGGVGFLVSYKILKNIVREPDPDIQTAEVKWIRMILKDQQHLCIGVYYGKQETHSAEKTLDEYNMLENRIVSYIANDTHVILLGDFNAKVGSNEKGIKNGDKIISRNGKMLLELIDHTDMVMMNATERCEGIWTRVNSQNEHERSILDYVLVSPRLATQVTDMVIDESEDHRLRSPKTKTDHNTITINLNVKFDKITVPKEQQRWKITANTDWEQFNAAVAQSPSMLQVFEHGTSSESYGKWLNILHEIANNIIGQFPTGKRKINPLLKDPEIQTAINLKKDSKAKYIQSLKNNEKDPAFLKNYYEAKEKLKEIFNEKEATRTNQQLQRMIDEGGVQSKSFWNIRRKLKKGNLQDMSAIKNMDGEREFNPDAIKEITAEYFENLYTPSEYDDFNPEWTKCIEELNKIRLELDGYEDMPYNQPLTFDETIEATKQLYGNRGVGPDQVPNEFMM